MAELHYFAANDPQTFKRRGGRILTAGVLLLLVGLGLGAIAAVSGYSLYVYRRDLGEEWLQVGTMWLALASAAVAATTAGVGLLGRRRWGRPLGYVLMTLWLAFGTAVAATVFVLEAIRLARGGSWYWSNDVGRLFWSIIVPFGLFLTLTVGLPGLVQVLLWPDDVRRTLELHDVRQRWTDGRSARRGATGLVLLAVAGMTAWFVLLDEMLFSYASHYTSTASVIYMAGGGAAALAAACVFVGRRATDRAGLTLAFLALTAFGYVGLAGYDRSAYSSSDANAVLCILGVTDAIAILLLAREARSASSSLTPHTR